MGFPWWMRPFLARGVAAITIGRRIWVDVGRASARPDGLKSVLRHERVHVRQMRDLGVLRFLWLYLREYFRNRLAGMSSDDAYRNISFEREAFAAETYNRRTGKDE